MKRVNTVVGATGLVGSAICRLLAAAGKPVRAMTRPTSDPAKVEGLRKLGAEIVQGDLKDRASLLEVCKGTETLFTTASSTLSRQPGDSLQTVDHEGQLALLEAAKAAGVRHVVLVSFHAMQGDFPLQAAKRSVEERLVQSGMTFTILQPSYFTEVWLSPALGFDVANAKARLFGTGEGRLNWISFEDVARFAVGALDNPRAHNAVLELGGEQALSQLDIIRKFEERSGKKFQVEQVPEQALREQTQSGEDPMQRSFAGLMLNVALGYRLDPKPALQAIPLRPKSIEEFVAHALSA